MREAEPTSAFLIGHRKYVYFSTQKRMLQQRETQACDAVVMCGASMDYANERLLSAFDPVSARLVKLINCLQGLLNHVIVLTRLDTGNCKDYASPYMVSLMPEPADYFMPCMNTEDCHLRCLDTYPAFDVALKASVAEPVFVLQIETMVESKYFSLEDIKEQRNVSPFEIISVSKLYPVACLTVCGVAASAANRCITVVGVESSRHTVGLAYYCIPSDITQYVHRYTCITKQPFQNTTWGHSEVVEEAFLASLHKVDEKDGHDDVVVLTQDRASLVRTLYLYTADRVGVTLQQTAVFSAAAYIYVYVYIYMYIDICIYICTYIHISIYSIHTYVNISWFLDQEIPSGGYVRIQDVSQVWEERVDETRIITTEGLTTCLDPGRGWTITSGG